MTISLGGPLLLVGAGKMGGALLAGWLERGLAPAGILVRDPEPAADVAALVRAHDIVLGAAPELPEPPAAVVLAVKPQIMDDVLPPLLPLIVGDTVVLSIAAGRTMASLERHLGERAAIVRSMPNLPASIGRSATSISATTVGRYT